MSFFILHDGEDEKRTDELHDFMASAKTVQVDEKKCKFVEWEGYDSGINIWYETAGRGDHECIDVSVGDKINIDADGVVTVEKKQ